MAIQISRVLRESEERKAAVPPLPKIKSKRIVIAGVGSVAFDHDIIKIVEGYPVGSVKLAVAESEKDVLLRELYDRLAQVKRDRSVLASGNGPMITRIHDQLKGENKGTADEFIKGNLPMPEVAVHYQRIQSLTDDAVALWDKIRHVEKYGELPVVQEAEKGSSDEGALKYKIRTLTDAISKTKSKLRGGKAYNPSRLIMWEEKVSRLEAQRDEAQRELKQLQLNVRNQQ